MEKLVNELINDRLLTQQIHNIRWFKPYYPD